MDRVTAESRRNYRRYPTEFTVSYRLDREGQAWQDGRSLNVSAGGLLLRAVRPVAGELADLLAERSMLNLTLPIGGRTIHVTARLVWTDDIEHSQECRLGLRFLDLESADQEFLWRWVLDHMDPDGPRASGSGFRQVGEAEASG